MAVGVDHIHAVMMAEDRAAVIGPVEADLQDEIVMTISTSTGYG